MPLTEADFREIPILPPGSYRRVGSITTWKFRKPTKKQLTIRLDHDVYEWLRAKGNGYQSMLNAMLRVFMDADRRPAQSAVRPKRRSA